MTPKEWMKDERVEVILKRYDIVFELVLRPLEDINQSLGFSTQARPKSLEEGLVDAYSIAMKQGATFPALVGYETNKGICLVSGNNRYAGAKAAGRKSVLIYLIPEPEDDQIKSILPDEFNLIEGARLDQRFNIEKAASLVTRFGMSAVEAASKYCVSDHSIGLHLRANECASRLAELGVSHKLPQTTLSKLHSLKSDVTLAHAANLISRAKLPSDDAARIVREISTHRSELKQLSAIESMQRQYGVSSNGKVEQQAERPRSIRQALSVTRRGITSMEKALDDNKTTLAKLGATTKETKKEITDRLTKISEKINRILRRN